jgi:hypothetical protein
MRAAPFMTTTTSSSSLSSTLVVRSALTRSLGSCCMSRFIVYVGENKVNLKLSPILSLISLSQPRTRDMDIYLNSRLDLPAYHTPKGESSFLIEPVTYCEQVDLYAFEA